MIRRYLSLLAVLLLIGLPLAGCGATPEAEADEEHPATVEYLSGEQPARVTLSADAARRLDVHTAPQREVQANGVRQSVIPYAAVIYDPQGNAWTYVSAQPLSFVRYAVTVDRIVGEDAYLAAGPPPGSAVVTVGAAELFGAETEFAEE